MERCIYCGNTTTPIATKTGRVVEVTKVCVPTANMEKIPYYVLLLEDDNGNRFFNKSLKEYGIGDILEDEDSPSEAAIGIVGTGTMGSALASYSLLHGFKVVIKGRSAESLARARDVIMAALSKRMAPQDAQRLVSEKLLLTDGMDALRTVPVVVEAVVEELAAKREIIRELDKTLPETIAITSNTSSIPIARLSDGCTHRHRIAGMHFFNPVSKMKLVEVVASDVTSQETVELVRSYAELLGKTPVVVKDSPGFVVNRLLVPLLNEAVMLVENGVARPEEIDTAVKLGLNHPMGPLALLDLIGLDVFVHIMDTIRTETSDTRYECSKLARQMVSEGKLGIKTGSGFYTYGAET